MPEQVKRGRGRPRKDPASVLGLRMPKSLIAALKVSAKKHKLSIAELLRELGTAFTSSASVERTVGQWWRDMGRPPGRGER